MLLALACLTFGQARAATLKEAREFFAIGEFAKAIESCEQAIAEKEYDSGWRLLLLRARLATGQYPEAKQFATQLLEDYRYRYNAEALWLFHLAYEANGDTESAGQMLQIIMQFLNGQRGISDENTLVYIGRALLKAAVSDPKQVKENLFDRVLKSSPDNREALLAVGELALAKRDFKLAGRTFTKAIGHYPEDADLLYGLAKAYAESDPSQMEEPLHTAMFNNPDHVPSLLLQAHNQADAEQYDVANGILKAIFKVNPHHAASWALQAALHIIRNEPTRAEKARANGLKYWKTNPLVDHEIGKKLSSKYLFAEGAAHQRQALKFSKDYIPAKTQLAQDLLRLGEDEEGWRLAGEAHEADGYDVTTFNLLTLHDSLKKYVTIERNGFLLRMTRDEAALYGDEAIDLLTEARGLFSKKYDTQVEGPVIVEIFPEKKDFAVRTFGIPGGDGYMGVCFGKLITANSPKSLVGFQQNWQSLLWHEYCHVITLQKTRNKMPRWFSEGISVYEERLRHRSWGEQMTPEYRDFILNGEMTPLERLSMAFLVPKSPEHMQFAYYQSSLVVEYLVEHFGEACISNILRDLGEGVFINIAIEQHAAPLAKLEEGFTAFATGLAKAFAPEADLAKPTPLEVNPLDKNAIVDWLEANPDNIWALNNTCANLIEEEKFLEAIPLIERSIRLHPRQRGGGSPYGMLARAHRELGQAEDELAVLEQWAAIEDAATKLYGRLMEIHAERENWEAVDRLAKRFFSANPLSPIGHRYMALSAQQSGNTAATIRPLKRLLLLDPADPVDLHFRLATALADTAPAEAKRHILQALEDAPRFRAAQKLLTRLAKPEPPVEEAKVE
ncbi:MAG: tetratricopeptide repeat protein [Verrucomicrobiota bacterium]|jgi:tetratricopeptide (TPR) repeat protein|nr:tetratricopeptide repeat protein [Verrucomicrobiota bacterium]MDP7049043.1 tetratricopeptide repeat protein [Verrucomicrobiota bacterium]